VHATIKSLQAVLEGDTSVGMIYIVSGYDIPIQPPSALFTTRSVITEGVFKNVVPFRSVIAFTPGEDMDLKGMKPEGNDFAIFMVLGSESFPLDFISHKPYILTYRSVWVGQTERETAAKRCESCAMVWIDPGARPLDCCVSGPQAALQTRQQNIQRLLSR
jgi:hypothetical protein